MSAVVEVFAASPLELVLGEGLREAARSGSGLGSGSGSRAAGVPGAVALAHDALDEVAESPVWALGGAQTGELIVALERLTATAAALQARLLAHAATGASTVDSTDEAGWTSQSDLVGWLAESLPVTRGEALRRVVLARDLEQQRHAPIADAMAAGAVSREQAAVIVEAVEAVPADATVTSDAGEQTPARELACSHLVEAAATWHVPGLKRLGRRILEVVDPVGAETREAQRVAAEEARAQERCSFSMAQDAQGSWVGRFVLPELAGSMLQKALTAIANPARETSGADSDLSDVDPLASPGRSSPRLKLGEAFAEYVERFPASALPAAAGGSATIVVTTTLADLRVDVEASASTLDTGGWLSAAETRRLACTAGVVPMVLGGESQPLDLGRERRLHSKAQRLAMAVRDGGCRAVGCDWPPGMCHAHHLRPWSRGGPTTVDDGILLCPRHHRLIHRPDITSTFGDDGRVHLSRR